MRKSTLLGAALAISLGALASCVIPGPRARIGVRADVRLPPPPTVAVGVNVATPNMAYVDDGVYVMENYQYPVFYTDGFYWRYWGNRWYRSRYHRGGWAFVGTRYLPARVRRIRRPRRYIRYRARPGVRRWRGPTRRNPRARPPRYRPGRRPVVRPRPRRPDPRVRPRRPGFRPDVRRPRPAVRPRPGARPAPRPMRPSRPGVVRPRPRPMRPSRPDPRVRPRVGNQPPRRKARRAPPRRRPDPRRRPKRPKKKDD